jgi:hypothetical protein
MKKKMRRTKESRRELLLDRLDAFRFETVHRRLASKDFWEKCEVLSAKLRRSHFKTLYNRANLQ